MRGNKTCAWCDPAVLLERMERQKGKHDITIGLQAFRAYDESQNVSFDSGPEFVKAGVGTA